MREDKSKEHIMSGSVCIICYSAGKGLSAKEIHEETKEDIAISVHMIKRHLKGYVRPRQEKRIEAKNLMKEGKMSNRQIAEFTGVSRNTLNRWKNTENLHKEYRSNDSN